MNDDIFYFGCRKAGIAGHDLHNPHLSKVYGRKDLNALSSMLDGLLLQAHSVPDVPGQGVWFYLAGYMILSWWDRSGDTRGASNSAIILRDDGTVTWQEFVDRAKSAFPEVFARQEVRIVDTRDPKRRFIDPPKAENP